MTNYLYFCVATAAIGLFHFGYHLGELNNISQILPCLSVQPYDGYPTFSVFPNCIPMSTIQFSLAQSLIALAGGIGALWAGYSCDRFGRRRTLLFLNIPMIISPLLLALSVNYPMIIMGRIYCGLATGGMLVVVPMYISEISPIHLRGRTGIFSTIGLGLGLAIAGLLGFYLSEPPYWRIIVGFSLITAILQVILLFFVPESPVYLRNTHQFDQANNALIKLNPLHIIDDASLVTESSQQPSDVINNDNSDNNTKTLLSNSVVHTTTPTIWRFLTDPIHRPSLLVLLLSHATQQLSGINVYFAYAYQILLLIFSPKSASIFYVIFAFCNIGFNMIPGVLLDRFGRRPLLLFSIFSMAFFAALFALSVQVFNEPYLALFSFIAAAFVFALGLSSVPFIITAEVVEPAVVGVASQVSLFVNTMSNFIMLFAFPLILEQLKGWSFMIFTGYLTIVGIIAVFLVPETKGRSPQDVIHELRSR